jgi:hypothetical protein|tara:strand:- start:70 stop:267 length:198 start_codon:yes stop_codon:yes gene_type:complete
MNPNINAESKNIKNGDLVKWRTWITYGIVIDDFNSHTVKIFWLSENEPEQVTWEQRTNVEVISES